MKIIFLGTPEIAVPFLEKLQADLFFKIQAVITAPDTRRGRKMKLTESPVKAAATRSNLPVYTPYNKSELAKVMSEIDFDCGVIVAYGHILSEKILKKPEFGFINVHFSLLPKHRGASPIQSAILAGDSETGISIFKLVKEMDAGPILSLYKLEISPSETSESLSLKLLAIGPEFLCATLHKYYENKAIFYEQNNALASYCGKIIKADGEISTGNNMAFVLKKIRAFSNWPGTFFKIAGTTIKILSAMPSTAMNIRAGMLHFENDKIIMGLKDGAIAIITLQPTGKRPLAAREFINGYKHFDGQFIGN